MTSASEVMNAAISQKGPAAFNDAESVLQNGEGLSPTAESIRGELILLSARQAEVQRRIQHIRRALIELVHVFGPGILESSGPTCKTDAQVLLKDNRL